MAQAQLQSRIVLAIDYGTTYTGLAWVAIRPNATATVENIDLFEQWPVRNQAKVPSTISYSSTEKGCRQWGFDIDDNSDVLQWTKLELQPRDTKKELTVLRDLMKGLQLVQELHTGKTLDLPRHISRSSEDIIREYLSRVTRHWYSAMTSTSSGLAGAGRNVFQNVRIDVVITHPVSWSYEALNKTYRAVMGALPRGMFPNLTDVSLMSEPEACALYTVRDMIRQGRDHTLIPGECFVLCDGGGGTVDLVSYRIDSIEPLSLTRVGYMTGRECGATFIEKRFIKWCDAKFQNMDIFAEDFGSGGHFVLAPGGRTLLQRFEPLKHAFDGNSSTMRDIAIPRTLRPKDETAMNTGRLPISEEDMEQFFEETVKGTVELITGQIAQIEGKVIGGYPCSVRHVFLAGGLSQNAYVVEKVKQSIRRFGTIEVQIAADGWSGVVKGAVLAGAGLGMNTLPKLSKCPRHYGICVAQEYQDWQHANQQIVQDAFHGRRMAQDPLIWLIKKGDMIMPNSAIANEFTISCKFTESAYRAMGKSVGIKFVATALDDAPTSLSRLPADSNQIVNIEIPLHHFPIEYLIPHRQARGRGNYYQVNVTATLKAGRDVNLDIKYNGMVIQTYSTKL